MVSWTGVEAHYVSKVASKKCGSLIGSGDEGGPVFDSFSNCDVSDSTGEVAEVVGPLSGSDTVSVSDAVVIEPYSDGIHMPEGLLKISVESVVHHGLSSDNHLPALTEDLSLEDDREGRADSILYTGEWA